MSIYLLWYPERNYVGGVCLFESIIIYHHTPVLLILRYALREFNIGLGILFVIASFFFRCKYIGFDLLAIGFIVCLLLLMYAGSKFYRLKLSLYEEVWQHYYNKAKSLMYLSENSIQNENDRQLKMLIQKRVEAGADMKQQLTVISVNAFIKAHKEYRDRIMRSNWYLSIIEHLTLICIIGLTVLMIARNLL